MSQTMYVIRDLNDYNPWSLYVSLSDKDDCTTLQFCKLEDAAYWTASEVAATIALLHERYPGWSFAAEVAP